MFLFLKRRKFARRETPPARRETIPETLKEAIQRFNQQFQPIYDESKDELHFLSDHKDDNEHGNAVEASVERLDQGPTDL